MIKHPLFVRTWPFLAVIGFFVFPMLYWALLWGDIGTLGPRGFKFQLNMYADFYSGMIWSAPYFSLALPVLIWSFVRWFKAPGAGTLLWTMFTTWVLCGYPGAFAVLWLSYIY